MSPSNTQETAQRKQLLSESHICLFGCGADSLTLEVYAAEGSGPLLQPEREKERESAALLAPWGKKKKKTV